MFRGSIEREQWSETGLINELVTPETDPDF